MSFVNRISCIVLLFAAPANAQLDLFLGAWDNTEPDTFGIRRLEITLNDDEIFVKAIVAGQEGESVWGPTRAYAYAPTLSSDLFQAANTISVTFAVAETSLHLAVLRLIGKRLHAEVLSRFVYQGNLTNVRTDYLFAKEFSSDTMAVPLDSAHVEEFISWAGRSTASTDSIVAAEIHKARDDTTVINRLFEEFESARVKDLGESLIILAIIGELGNPRALPRLISLVREPSPEFDVFDGENLTERDYIDMLQAKGVEAIANIESPGAARFLEEIIQTHRSVSVRAKAIHAFLVNHGYSEAAKDSLRAIVMPEDLPFVDRVDKISSGSPEEFNEGLRRFYELHPDQVAEPSLPDPSENIFDKIKRLSFYLYLIIAGLILLLIIIGTLIYRKYRQAL